MGVLQKIEETRNGTSSYGPTAPTHTQPFIPPNILLLSYTAVLVTILCHHPQIITSPYLLNQIKSDSKHPIAKGWEIKIPSLQGLPLTLFQPLEALYNLQHSGRSRTLLSVPAHGISGSWEATVSWVVGCWQRWAIPMLHPRRYHTRYHLEVMLPQTNCWQQGYFPSWTSHPLPPSQPWGSFLLHPSSGWPSPIPSDKQDLRD